MFVFLDGFPARPRILTDKKIDKPEKVWVVKTVITAKHYKDKRPPNINKIIKLK